ncbi:MAG: hypothetical protein WC712_12415 [Candidatus Brocadiia bacterium]
MPRRSVGKTAASAKDLGYLEDVVKSLQKSFSRVSRDTAVVSESAARARVVGRVRFTMGLTVTPEGDRLRVDPAGIITLSIEGEIEPNVRYKTGDTSDRADER